MATITVTGPSLRLMGADLALSLAALNVAFGDLETLDTGAVVNRTIYGLRLTSVASITNHRYRWRVVANSVIIDRIVAAAETRMPLGDYVIIAYGAITKRDNCLYEIEIELVDATQRFKLTRRGPTLILVAPGAVLYAYGAGPTLTLSPAMFVGIIASAGTLTLSSPVGTISNVRITGLGPTLTLVSPRIANSVLVTAAAGTLTLVVPGCRLKVNVVSGVMTLTLVGPEATTFIPVKVYSGEMTLTLQMNPLAPIFGTCTLVLTPPGHGVYINRYTLDEEVEQWIAVTDIDRVIRLPEPRMMFDYVGAIVGATGNLILARTLYSAGALILEAPGAEVSAGGALQRRGPTLTLFCSGVVSVGPVYLVVGAPTLTLASPGGNGYMPYATWTTDSVPVYEIASVPVRNANGFFLRTKRIL